MRNNGIVVLVAGLVLVFISGLKPWLIILIGLIGVVLGLLMILAPDKAGEVAGKLKSKKSAPKE
jgi:F0F1-type ATP synthase assembly protein I